MDLIVAPYLARGWHIRASIIAARGEYRLISRYVVTSCEHVIIRQKIYLL
jgi:hypothetical protein